VSAEEALESESPPLPLTIRKIANKAMTSTPAAIAARIAGSLGSLDLRPLEAGEGDGAAFGGGGGLSSVFGCSAAFGGSAAGGSGTAGAFLPSASSWASASVKRARTS